MAMSGIWGRLSLYESRDVVARLFKEAHGREANAGKATEIVSHLAQGREYFASAREAGELVRPLLVYYGVLALTRGVTLFKNRVAREASLVPQHGVHADGWAHALSADSGGIKKVPELRMRPTAGTFADLSTATSNLELLSTPFVPFANTLEWGQRGTRQLEDTAMSVRNVLERIPDLQELFEETFGEHGQCYPAYVYFSSIEAGMRETHVEVIQTRLGLPPIDRLRAAFGLPSDLTIEEHKVSPLARRFYDGQGIGRSPYIGGGFRSLTFVVESPLSPVLDPWLPPIKHDRTGNVYVVAPFPDGTVLSTLSLLFLASYATGMLVRYFPSQWLALVGRNKGDLVFPLLRAAIDLVQERYPELVLTILDAFSGPDGFDFEPFHGDRSQPVVYDPPVR